MTGKTNDANDDINDQTKSTAFDDLPGKKTGDGADYKPRNDPMFHWTFFHCRRRIGCRFSRIAENHSPIGRQIKQGARDGRS